MSISSARAHGVVLPTPAAPAGAYVPAVRAGALVWVSASCRCVDGKLTWTGRVDDEVTTDPARGPPGLCAVNGLGRPARAVGTLETVRRIVRVTGYVASSPALRPAQVINGASGFCARCSARQGAHPGSRSGGPAYCRWARRSSST